MVDDKSFKYGYYPKINSQNHLKLSLEYLDRAQLSHQVIGTLGTVTMVT